MKIRNITVAFVLSLTFLIVYNLSAFSYSCQTIRDDAVRLHILANSDSQQDQELKLEVRDAILRQSGVLTQSVDSGNEALTVIGSAIGEIQKIAEEAVNENGYGYKVKAEIVSEYFSTRVYDDITVPAGRYHAVKITIGEGKGQNWWCMLFPSVCIPAAEGNSAEKVFSEEQYRMVKNASEYELRFKFIEYFELLKCRFS